MSPGLQLQGDSKCLAALLTALAKAAGEFGTLKADKKGQVGNQTFLYADLGMIMAVVRGPLAKNGVAPLQSFTGSPRGSAWQRLTTILAGHGAVIRSDFDFEPAPLLAEHKGGGNSLQKMGLVWGYLRRMQLQAILGIAPGPDIDDQPFAEGEPARTGKQATPPPTNTRRPAARKPPPKPEAQATAPAKPAAEKPAPKAQGTSKPAEPPTEKTIEKIREDLAKPAPVPDAVEEPQETDIELEMSDDQKLEIRTLAKQVGCAQIPALNRFIKVKLGPALEASNLDGKSAQDLIAALKTECVRIQENT